jgi:hypothetical protein
MFVPMQRRGQTRRGVPRENISSDRRSHFLLERSRPEMVIFYHWGDPQRGSIMTTFLLALLSIGIFLAHAIDAIRAPGAKATGRVLHQNTSTGQNWLRSREML